MTMSAESSDDASAPQGRIPDFFIVGHPKSGTTALYEMLRRHPQIHMPVKEPWFFSPELRSRLQPEGSPQQPVTLDGYLSLFDAALPGQRVGDATPSYLRSRTAAARIAALQPGARIVAILREPTSFLRSMHLQDVQSHIETETDFGKAIALEGARREGREIPRDCARPDALLYSEQVRYVEQLRRYEALFGAEQMLVLVYDDFRLDNEATVRRVLRFLDVDDSAPIAVLDANPTVRLRWRRLDSLLHAVSLGRGPVALAVKASIKALTPRRLRRRALQATQRRVVYGKPRPADESVMRELRARFKGEVVALSEYLDRDLVTLWGYENVV
ncbi:MAG: sulfotransferase family protein [Solirubrobacterales bacterium]